MKKFNIALSLSFLGLLSVIAVGCGKNNNGNQQAAAGICPVGQSWINNQCINQWNTNSNWNVPGGPVFQGFTCQQGQVRLNNRCFFAQNLQQACSMAGGQMMNQSLCRTERLLQPINRASYSFNLFRRYGARSRSAMQISGARPGETIKIVGNIESNYSWQLSLLQSNIGYTSMMDPYASNGPSIMATTSSSNTTYGDEGNVLLMGQVAGQQQNYMNNNAPGTINPMMYQMPMNTNVYLYVESTGGTYLSLDVSAISCEDGAGNSYPCQ